MTTAVRVTNEGGHGKDVEVVIINGDKETQRIIIRPQASHIVYVYSNQSLAVFELDDNVR